MGWSCSDKAGHVLDKWRNFCQRSSGYSNIYEYKGKKYMFEIGNKEHEDGSVTGTIFEMIQANPNGSGLMKPRGSFRINGSGKIDRAPLILKNVAYAAPIPPED